MESIFFCVTIIESKKISDEIIQMHNYFFKKYENAKEYYEYEKNYMSEKTPLYNKDNWEGEFIDVFFLIELKKFVIKEGEITHFDILKSVKIE
jgi:hypothetical protein